jgi:thiamine-phosphate pyrophosphorylase
MVQIRERDLPARDTLFLAEAIASSCSGTGAQILVNDRVDIARSAAVGVHLTTRSLTADVVRAVFGSSLLIGVSTHSLEEARSAELNGADFIVFGPVFETPSKRSFGNPVGIEALERVTSQLTIPVLAIGGIKLTNFQDAMNAGAAGIAGISLFTDSKDLEATVATIKGYVKQ